MTSERKRTAVSAVRPGTGSRKGSAARRATGKTAARKRRGKNVRRRGSKRGLRRLLPVIAAAVILLAVIIVLCVSSGNGRGPAPVTKRVSYPVGYEELIIPAALQNGLEPGYVAAIIMAESSYDPEAVSHVNAQGLMQLLPDTAEWIAGKLGENYEEGMLFDPETNIRYGCWYMGWLYARYDQDRVCASAAYHAGQGTVDKWLENSETEAFTTDAIPSDATRTYVERILNYEEYYDEIFKDI